MNVASKGVAKNHDGSSATQWQGVPGSGTGVRLQAASVPEPANVALGILAGLFLLVIVFRVRLVRNRVRRWRGAFTQWLDAV